MTTTELIEKLRQIASETEYEPDSAFFAECADRLEELDERVAIMMEGNE